MEQKQPNIDITPEVQQALGAQMMEIITLTKQNKELNTMLKAMEKEKNELKEVQNDNLG